ncbi:MAG: T9SS type A sorting domain-containing protein [Saprospiraceae bacterium]
MRNKHSPTLFASAFLLLGSCFQLIGQSIFPEVTAAAGDSYTAPNQTRLSWTMGETAVETYTIGNTRLGQGFHQMYVHPLSVPTTEVSPLAGLIRISPNPTSGLLGVENLSGLTFSVVASDASGRQVFTAQNIGYHQQLNFINYPVGTYLLQFFYQSESITTFKIVKQ